MTALFAALLTVTWRRWPDPLLDFGRDLYIPWMMNQGAALYRDIEHAYGPLTQHLNAALFRLFEPSVITIGQPAGSQFMAMDCTINPLRALRPAIAINAFALNYILENAITRDASGAVLTAPLFAWYAGITNAARPAATAAYVITIAMVLYAVGRFSGALITRSIKPHLLLALYGFLNSIVILFVIVQIVQAIDPGWLVEIEADAIVA